MSNYAYGRGPYRTNDSNDPNDHLPNPTFNNDSDWLWPDDLQQLDFITTLHEAPPPPLPQPQPQPLPQQPPSEPHFHRQLPPIHHTSPSSSLNAALREGTTLPSIRSMRMPTSASALSHTTHPPHRPSRQSSFGYISDNYFDSPARLNVATAGSEEDIADDQPRLRDIPRLSTTHPEILRSRSQQQQQRPPPQPQQQPSMPHHRSNDTIDLTSANNNMPTAPPSASRPRKRWRDMFGSSPEPEAKRRRASVDDEPEHIDLDDEEAIDEQAILDKERAEQVQKQKDESTKDVKLSNRTCMICMEPYTNMCATHCGHTFCHECLHQALTASERGTETGVGVCPACRKPIKRGRNAKLQIIPLAMLKGVAGKKKEYTRTS